MAKLRESLLGSIPDEGNFCSLEIEQKGSSRTRVCCFNWDVTGVKASTTKIIMNLSPGAVNIFNSETKHD